MSKEILDRFINEMSDLLRTAKDFTVEQVPEVAKEILKYNFANSLAWTIVGFIYFALSYSLHRKVREMVKEDYDWTPMYVFVGIAYLTSAATVFCNLDIAMKIYFAPKLYLLEYIANLVSSHK